MKDLKTPFFTILFIFLFLFLYTKLSGPIPFFINSLQTTKTNMFQVVGEGKATAVPDTAMVSVGVTSKAQAVEDAQAKTNRLASKIIEDIKKLGIEEKNIKTVNYSVNPDYDYSRGQTITGYTVNQTLEIKVKPIEKVNRVIDTATLDGANLIQGASFVFGDELQKKLEDEARKQAVDNARAKAESLANAAGIRLGKIIDVSESNQAVPILLRGDLAVGGVKETPPTNITPGENSVNITVTLSYETY